MRRELRAVGKWPQPAISISGASLASLRRRVAQRCRGAPRRPARRAPSGGTPPTNGKIGRRRLVLVARSRQHERAVQRRLDRELARETRLPGARLAARPAGNGRAPARARRQSSRASASSAVAADEPAARQRVEDRHRGCRTRLRDRCTGSDRDALERRAGFRRRGESLSRLLGEQAYDHGIERFRKRRAACARGGTTGACTCWLTTASGLAPVNGSRPVDQLVEHHAQRVEIGAPVDRLAQRLLWRHVGRRCRRSRRRP